MNTMLDEDAAALGFVPEPVFVRQVFIRGVVLEISMQEIAQQSGLDQVFDRIKNGVVPLHQVDRQKNASISRAMSIIASACSSVIASGFSHRTCLPAASAASP